MAYYTEAHFKYYHENLSESQRTFSTRARSDLNTTFDIFVSYNFNDEAIIKGVYNELTEMGFKVYVDFIVDAQSPSAAMSRWMPWELGVVDGHTKKCAVLPILVNSTDIYYKQEYLKLYPVIRPSTTNSMYVYRDDNGIEKLSTIYSFVNF